MRGFHKVRIFTIWDAPDVEEVSLPEGWKPFGVGDVTSRYTKVIARKWERTED